VGEWALRSVDGAYGVGHACCFCVFGGYEWIKGDFEGSKGVEYDPSISLIRGKIEIVLNKLVQSYYLLSNV
jgi:hypothetical protein